jgi:type III secretion protein Q
MPKSALRAAGASDCRPLPPPYPLAHAGEGREGAGASLALPAVSPAQVKSLNAFYRRRPALAFSVAGCAATMTASWPSASGDVSGKCRLDITVDGAAGAVILSRPLIAAVIAALDPNQRLDGLDPPHVGLLLELALSDALSMLEASLGARLAITCVRAADDDRQNAAAALAFNIAVDGIGTSCGELLLQPGHAIMFAQFLDRCALPPDPPRQAGEGKSINPPPLAGEGREAAAIEWPATVCVRVAAATFAVGEIATLSPGDVVMADQSCQQMQTAVHLVAPVDLTTAGAQIAARPTRARGSLWEWSMENGGDRSPTDVLQKTDLDDIPVKLLFELGRIELSLAEIRQLAPGALIALQRPLEDSVDILANGRRIGRGNLVQIGDSLGIRITRLFDNV